MLFSIKQQVSAARNEYVYIISEKFQLESFLIIWVLKCAVCCEGLHIRYPLIGKEPE